MRESSVGPALLSRRGWLGSAVAVGASAFLLSGPDAQAKRTVAKVTASARAPLAAAAVAAGAAVGPFDLAQVALGSGVMSSKRSLMLDYARSIDPDRLLVPFRATAGLDPGDVTALIGWEQATSTLRGHYAGHFMKMLAQAYASTHENSLQAAMTVLVNGIHESREALQRANPWVLSTSGPFDKAVKIAAGSAQYVDLPSSAGLGSGSAFTLSIWARPSTADNWARLYEAGDSTSKFLFLAARDGSGVPRFAINAGSGESVVSGTDALPLNTWSHVAVTLSDGSLNLYVDGSLVGTTTGVTVTPESMGALADHWVGRSHFASDPQFSGALSELNIWDRALTASEISELQSSTASASGVGIGTVASFAFDDVDTATVANQTTPSQPATMKRTWGAPSAPGFVSAYPETQFILLESITVGSYPTVWAPYYTIDKILAGLVAVYRASTDATTKAQALDLASGLCDWMYGRLSVLPDATLQRMWSLFSSGEYGGVQESIIDTYELTGDDRHKTLATLFDNRTLFKACAEDSDILDGLHANQHIPPLIGAIRQHEAGITPSWLDGSTYLDAARNFWPMVVDHRAYTIGGTGSAEFWGPSDEIASRLSTSAGPETCCTYNLLKLGRLLFRHDQDAKYMEYYEKALFNHILGSKQDAASTNDRPLATYPNPQGPGSVRNFAPYDGATCCEGTGMESATKYQDTVFMATEDNLALYVNLFVPSTLDWTATGLTITQQTTFPVEQGTTLTISGSASFALRLRRPAWATSGYVVKVNGATVDVSGVPAGSYLEINRSWSSGDTVTVAMPFKIRTEATPDDPTLRSVFYGPLLLVALSTSTATQTVSISGSARLSGDLIDAFKPVSGSPNHFTSNGLTWAPFYEGTTLQFHSYATHKTPKVTFAGKSAGVENRTNGSTTLLDDIWGAAPFTTKQAFLNQVQASTTTWRAAGLLSRAEQQRVLLAAGKASVKA